MTNDHLSYNSRDYPVGITDFLNTFPPERRGEVLAAVRDLHLRKKAAEEWVDRQVQGMLEVPDILYKYALCERLDCDFPNSLRATQPPALNDVMEGNITTMRIGPMLDRDEWRMKVSEALKRDGFSLPTEELKRRMHLYGDPRISTIIQDYLARFVGVVSFSIDPLIQTMWAHYTQNSGFVVGYNTQALSALGLDLRKIIYMELAPSYTPTRDNMIRLNFVDEESRKRKIQEGDLSPGTTLLSPAIDFVKLQKDWRTLARLLFVKGKSWEYEKEARLLVDLQTTRIAGEKDGWPIRVLEIPREAIEEVYVGFNPPEKEVERMKELFGKRGGWKLKYTSSHAYRMQVTSTSIY